MKFQPDLRSVFFNSLSQDPKYAHLYQIGIQSFQQNSLIIKNGQFNSKIQHNYEVALNILKQGITYEKSNERAYFNDVLKTSNLSPNIQKIFIKRLSQIFSNDIFNYIEFINLINEILLGKKQYRAILLLEQNRLRELKIATDNLLTTLTGTINKDTNSIRTRESLLSEIRDEYLKKHQVQKFRGFYANVLPTIDNIISKFINDTIHIIVTNESFLTQIEKIYENGKDVNTEKTNLILQIINNTLIAIQKPGVITNIIESTLKHNENKLKMLSEVTANNIVNSFHTVLIKNQKYNYGQKGDTPIVFTINEKTHQVKTTGKGLADMLLEYNLEYKKDPNNIFYQALNDKDSQIYTDLKELQKLIKELEQMNRKISPDKDALNTLEKTIRDKKGILSTKCRKIIDQIVAQYNDELKIKMLEDIRTSLTRTFISISGPSYSEIIDAVIQKLLSSLNETYFSGPFNLKADAIIIRNDDIKLKTSEYSILNSLDNDFHAQLSNMSDEFYMDFQSNLPKAGEATNLSQGKLALSTAIKNKFDHLSDNIKKQNLEQEQEAQAMEELATYMKNSIFVTETMKTFDNYQNEYGFISGSLGPNISTQLENFNSLFQAAGVGMSQTEIQWLESAIVNCSPYALGRQNQGPIEKYLSTLAGFAVFDEGSFEVSLIAKTASQFYLDNSPKILHLYKLNGIYYPGSYILQKIYDNLHSSLANIEQKTINTGDGVKIRATMSESDIPKDVHKISERWKTTYNTALDTEHTSIEITFLSGLLNIVDQLLNPNKILPT